MTIFETAERIAAHDEDDVVWVEERDRGARSPPDRPALRGATPARPTVRVDDGRGDLRDDGAWRLVRHGRPIGRAGGGDEAAA